MALIKEDIIAALGNPEAAEYKLLFDTLTEKEVTALHKKDLNSFYDNERARIASEKTSEIYSNLDKDIMEASGFKKNSEEKTYDFAKRAVNSYKTKTTELESKVSELENKIKEGSQDRTLVTQVEALNAKIAQHEAEKNDFINKLIEKDVNIEIKDALRGLPSFKKDLPEDVIKEFVNSTTAKLMQSAKVDNGKVVFYNGDKPILDDKAQVATAEYILKDRLKSILDTGRQQQGAGSGDTGKGGNTFTRITKVPAGVTTRGELMDSMIKSGYIKNSKEMDEDYGKLSAELKLR